MSESLSPTGCGPLEALRLRTPARILTDRAGSSYTTRTQLELRRDHAAARDAVWDEIDLERDLPQLDLLEITTRAGSKQEYLLRPDLGRQLHASARVLLGKQERHGMDLLVVVGDGLSASAVRLQVPLLLPMLLDRARQLEWKIARPFFIRHCRVGILNELGELLDPSVAVLLIGERPGLATADSLSAYMAYRPRPGDTDAQRNLISNIHGRGVGHEEAVNRILALALQMRQAQASGVTVKERRQEAERGRLPG